MAVTKAKKTEVLNKVTEQFGRAKAIYFSGYRGINVKKMVALRKKLHQSGVDFVVVKKTLFNIAAKAKGLPGIPDDIMVGPVAAAIGYDDVITPVKLLHEFSKDAEQLDIQGGMIEGRYIGKAEARALATLPSRQELLAKLVGSLKSPITGLHGTLSGVLRKFVYALSALRDKQSA